MVIGPHGATEISRGLDYEVVWRLIRESPDVPDDKNIRWQVFQDLQIMEIEQLKLERE